MVINYAYVVHPEAKGSVVVSPGRIEGLVKYKETVYDLYQSGYSVFIIDHRGQGQSGRMTDDPEQGHVEEFDDYVEDLHHFYTHVVARNTSHKPMLLCHSMGSAIGALYVLKHPDHFSKVAFSAPMFGVRPVLPDWFVSGLLAVCGFVNRLFSDHPWYFPGQGPYAPAEFNDNVLTHSEVRYRIFRQEYESHPQNKLGGVTIGWLKAAQIAMNTIENNAHRFPIPVLHMQAGGDRVVDNQRQSRVCGRIPEILHMTFDDAHHELLMEADNTRVPVMEAVFEFFAKPLAR